MGWYYLLAYFVDAGDLGGYWGEGWGDYGESYFLGSGEVVYYFQWAEGVEGFKAGEDEDAKCFGNLERSVCGFLIG